MPKLLCLTCYESKKHIVTFNRDHQCVKTRHRTSVHGKRKVVFITPDDVRWPESTHKVKQVPLSFGNNNNSVPSSELMDVDDDISSISNQVPQVNETSGENGSSNSVSLNEKRLANIETAMMEINKKLDDLKRPNVNNNEVVNEKNKVTFDNIQEQFPHLIFNHNLNDCTIYCERCRSYLQNGGTIGNARVNNSLSTGLTKSKSEMEAMKTNSQKFAHFKQIVKDHFTGKSKLHLRALQSYLKSKGFSKSRFDIAGLNQLRTALTVVKTKSAMMHYETLLSFGQQIGGEVGDIGMSRKRMPEILQHIDTYLDEECSKVLRQPLKSTGMPPHFFISVDKSTPRRETNQALLLLFVNEGKRVAFPVSANVVYKTSDG